LKEINTAMADNNIKEANVIISGPISAVPAIIAFVVLSH
tara:strand:+ start:522 stop:638 length:117 start_codon:yes stop_codon:yes gene_type:complete